MPTWSRAGARLPALGEPRECRGLPLLFCELSRLLVCNVLLQLTSIESSGSGLVERRPLALAAAASAASLPSGAPAACPRYLPAALPPLPPSLALRRICVIPLALLATAKHVAGARASPNRGRQESTRRSLRRVPRSFVPVFLLRSSAAV